MFAGLKKKVDTEQHQHNSGPTSPPAASAEELEKLRRRIRELEEGETYKMHGSPLAPFSDQSSLLFLFHTQAAQLDRQAKQELVKHFEVGHRKYF